MTAKTQCAAWPDKLEQDQRQDGTGMPQLAGCEPANGVTKCILMDNSSVQERSTRNPGLTQTQSQRLGNEYRSDFSGLFSKAD